jgi:hypothetical protein
VRFVQIFLRQHRRSFAVSEISRRRADEFGNFVRMLKFGAVDFDDRMRFAKQNLRCRFDNSRFSEPVGPKNRSVPTGRAGLFIPAK